MNRLLARVTVLGVLVGSLGLTARATADDELSVKLYQKTVNACVVIHAIESKRVGNSILTRMGRGSGSLIDAKQKLILTNWHVVEELSKVWVDFPIYIKKGKDQTMFQDPEKYAERAEKGEAILGRVLARDQSRDLAIVKLDKLPAHAVQIPLARKSPSVGETTWNIGSPGRVAQLFSITEGKVRAVGQTSMVVRGEEGFEVKAMVVTATNPTNPGDSGGPLFDKNGHQVAVTESGLGGTVQQVNSFIDVMEVRKFLKEKKIEINELVPPEPGTETVADPKTRPGTTAKDGPPAEASAADEKEAAAMLARAKRFGGDEENRNIYVQKLQELVKKYPTTAAGKEAKKLLGSQK